MIRFFRKIRKDLWQGNRVTRYFLYAIGEIILLVIGIMIAVKLNNLNDESKSRAEEVENLKGIVENLNGEITSIGNHIEVQKLKMNSYTILLLAFQDSNVLQDRFLMESAIKRAQWVYDYEPMRTAYDAMRHTGKVTLIRSEKIKEEILKYYVFSEAVVKAETMYNQSIIEHQHEIFTRMIDWNAIIEESMEPKWKSKLDTKDALEFFYRPSDDDLVKEFANRISWMKSNTGEIIYRENRLLDGAYRLRNEILEYLDIETQEIPELDMSADSDFKPSIPRHLSPLTPEDMEALIGMYAAQNDLMDTLSVFIESGHPALRLFKNGNTTFIYQIEKDIFNMPEAFLFDDELYRRYISVARDGNGMPSSIDLKWFGEITKYVRVDGQ